MSVIRITARMAAPIATRDESLHLDSIIMQSIARRRGISTPSPDRRTPLSSFARVPMPIPVLNWRGHSVYMCSAAQFPDEMRRGVERFTSKPDAVDLHLRAGAWTPGAGPERAYCVSVPTIETPTVSWLCVGRRATIRQAVRAISTIGAYRRHGFGRVLSWIVDVVDDDLESILIVDGKAARHLPKSWCASCAGHDIGATAPPYWHPERSIERVRVGVKCRLEDGVKSAVLKFI